MAESGGEISDLKEEIVLVVALIGWAVSLFAERPDARERHGLHGRGYASRLLSGTMKERMSDHDGQYIDYGPKDSGSVASGRFVLQHRHGPVLTIGKSTAHIAKESRHDGKGLANACESLERDGWEIMSASAVESSAHWNTTSFVVVARRRKEDPLDADPGGVFCSGCMARYSRPHESWCPVVRPLGQVTIRG